MRILIATDAWKPQVNGVVNTYVNLERAAPGAGFSLSFMTPAQFKTLPMPGYSEIELALVWPSHAARAVERERPDCIHIATEGPIGLAMRAYCLRSGRRFTTSYHTRFPEYAAARAPVPLSWGYRFERWFHNAGAGVMAPTRSMCEELTGHGLKNLHLWSRGVDLELFRPRERGPVRPAPPAVPLCRPRCGREKPRRLFEPRSAGQQGCCRRRTAA